MELSRLMVQTDLGAGWRRLDRNDLPPLYHKVEAVLDTGVIITAWRVPYEGGYQWIGQNERGEEYSLWEKAISYVKDKAQ